MVLEDRSYTASVVQHARKSPDLLDLGTRGGEWLAELPYRPRRTIATEAWPPNVRVAKARLAPLGIHVVQVAPARDNTDVGALAWGLKAIAWMVPNFSIKTHRARLREIQARIDRDGPITVRQRRFWVRARKRR